MIAVSFRPSGRKSMTNLSSACRPRPDRQTDRTGRDGTGQIRGARSSPAAVIKQVYWPNLQHIARCQVAAAAATTQSFRVHESVRYTRHAQQSLRLYESNCTALFDVSLPFPLLGKEGSGPALLAYVQLYSFGHLLVASSPSCPPLWLTPSLIPVSQSVQPQIRIYFRLKSSRVERPTTSTAPRSQ